MRDLQKLKRMGAAKSKRLFCIPTNIRNKTVGQKVISLNALAPILGCPLDVSRHVPDCHLRKTAIFALISATGTILEM